MITENTYWTQEIIKKLDDVLTNLGEELDSIMVSTIYFCNRQFNNLQDVANEDE